VTCKTDPKDGITFTHLAKTSYAQNGFKRIQTFLTKNKSKKTSLNTKQQE